MDARAHFAGRATAPSVPTYLHTHLLLSYLQDKRLLQVYLQQFFSNAMLQRGAKRLAPGVVLPSSAAHADYVGVIKGLAAQDAPIPTYLLLRTYVRT